MQLRSGISSKTTDQDQIARYRSLLLGEMDGDGEEDEEKDVDMEITWEPTLNEIKEGEVCRMICADLNNLDTLIDT